MSETNLIELSTDFAVAVLNLTDSIQGHTSLKNQIERSGTSIGANIREANYAHSKADFIAKLQIALKEAYETEYWLELLCKAKLANEQTLTELTHKCGAIRRVLIASLTTAKSNT